MAHDPLEFAEIAMTTRELEMAQATIVRVRDLAEKWNAAEDMVNGGKSLVSRAFAADLLNALDNTSAK